MKSIFRRASFMLAVAVSMALAAPASAATLTTNFNTGDNRVIQATEILGFEKDTFNSAVKITQMSGSVQSFADPTGALYTRLVAYATGPAVSVFVRTSPTANRYLRTDRSTEILCQSNETKFVYPTGAPSITFADSCALHATVKSLTTTY